MKGMIEFFKSGKVEPKPKKIIKRQIKYNIELDREKLHTLGKHTFKVI